MYIFAEIHVLTVRELWPYYRNLSYVVRFREIKSEMALKLHVFGRNGRTISGENKPLSVYAYIEFDTYLG